MCVTFHLLYEYFASIEVSTSVSIASLASPVAVIKVPVDVHPMAVDVWVDHSALRPHPTLNGQKKKHLDPRHEQYL